MAGPQRSNNPDIVSLREYLESRLDGLSETMRATATSLDKRLEGMNEFRSAMNDQRINLESRIGEGIPRSEYVVQHRALESQVAQIREWQAKQEGKASQSSVWGAYVVAVIGWMIGIGSTIVSLISQ